MKFRSLVALLPCQSLEDLALRRSAREADQLLAAWTALWHPALLVSAGGLPSWSRAESPIEDAEGYLFVLPGCCEGLPPIDWAERARASGAVILEGIEDRPRLVAAALAELDEPPVVDAGLAADFYALGFAYLQIELLTRQLRYMSNLDELSVQTRALEAAAAALAGDAVAAREGLKSAFEVVHEAREYFYPVELNLLDLTLLAASTAGEELRSELARGRPQNIVVDGRTLETIAEEEPESLAALRAAVEAGTAALLGGEYQERPLPLVPLEVVRRQLVRGGAVYERLLGQRPAAFARRRFGLSPLLPQVLFHCGYAAGVHVTLDDGQFPTGNQSRIRWTGVGPGGVEALARVPLDAGRGDEFLRMPERLGDVMDLDHNAAMAFAHWPGMTSPWYEDLQRATSLGTALGTMATLPQFLRDTPLVGQTTKYEADQYRSPYLMQAAAAGQIDPLSRYVVFYRRLAAWQAWRSLDLLAVAAGKASAEAMDGAEALFDRIESRLEADEPRDDDLDRRLNAEVDAACLAVAGQGNPAADRSSRVWINPGFHARRLPAGVEPGWPAEALELPSGSWSAGGAGAAAAPTGGWFAGKPQPAAEGNVLRNEYFEVALNPTTGAIQSIVEFNQRGNRMAQQLAARMPSSDVAPEEFYEQSYAQTFEYSIMAADELRTTVATTNVGQIECRGRLMSRQGERLAGFVQRTTVRRGSRIVELEIDLDIDRLPTADPWRTYYCVRFAWDDESAALARGIGLTSQPTSAQRIEAPQFIDVASGRSRVTLLTGGLPFHRRQGLRMLDTLLVVAGERARSFKLGIGLSLPHPPLTSAEFLQPPLLVDGGAAPGGPPTSYFGVDARNVVVTACGPIAAGGNLVGFWLRLLETEGQAATAKIRGPRPIGFARKVNARGVELAAAACAAGVAAVPLEPHEWVHVECRFEPDQPAASSSPATSPQPSPQSPG